MPPRTSHVSRVRQARRELRETLAVRDALRAGATAPADETVPAGAAPAETARPVRVSSPGSLLAVIPPLLGFRPQRSIVVVGTEPPRSAVRVTLRYDLPDPADAGQAAMIARHVVGVLAAQQITTAVAAGYGPDELVRPVAAALRDILPGAGITVREVLRVEDGRYWSYVCTNPGCCPPEGVPFTAGGSGAGGALGGVAVLASREVLAATIAPATGAEAESMGRAVRAAEESARKLGATAGELGQRKARRTVTRAGLGAVMAAVEAYRAGGAISHGDAARLLVALRDLQVRDDAWSRMDPAWLREHLRLWSDLTRLARPGYSAAPASLLAFVAWQSGNGALANVALDRALADNRRYSMATLLRQVLDSGAPPSMARLPMTPEEVAASYDADGPDDDGDGDGQENGGESTAEDDAPAGDGERTVSTAG